MTKSSKNILWLKELNHNDVKLVGSKNANLGELYNHLRPKGVNIPNAFAITTQAYFSFMKEAGLKEKINKLVNQLRVKDIGQVQKTGKAIRTMILNASWPEHITKEVFEAYHRLSKEYREEKTDVAVRASATMEGLANFSFAGQQESYLNVRGEEALRQAIQKCLASLFTDQALVYRAQAGFSKTKIAISVGIQKMVRSDLGSAGVMFTLDPESGFSNIVLINSAFGLGKFLVGGSVVPDEFWVFKPSLKKKYPAIIKTQLGNQKEKLVYGKKGIKKVALLKKQLGHFSLSNEEVLILAKWGCLIEDYYSRMKGSWDPRDIEWAKDGRTNKLFIVETRPETVHRGKKISSYTEYQLKTEAPPILQGMAIGKKVVYGRVRIIHKVSELNTFKPGEILVTHLTDPNWISVIKLSSALIADEGSKTCHAAIISRELGIPCVVGTQKATRVLKTGQVVTVDCSGAQGKVFAGKIPYRVKKYNLEKIPKVKPKVFINIGAPDLAFETSFLPVAGVGLVREEFIIANDIRVHPLALYHFAQLKNKSLKKKIEKITSSHPNKKQFFVDRLAEGIGQIAAAFWPRPVIVRFSDFKTNEYRQLLGGELFEPQEDNPMLGWRGASRYYSPQFKPAFHLECKAVKKVREEFGLTNVITMIPFCRTVEEGKKVLKEMEKAGLKKGAKGMKVYVMAEVPSNILLADEFLKIFDGFSIGSNDLTQLTLGLDRDSSMIASIGDERNEAVKKLVAQAIQSCRRRNKYSGICGEAPSNYSSFALFLAKEGIESISVSAPVAIKTISLLAKVQGLKKK